MTEAKIPVVKDEHNSLTLQSAGAAITSSSELGQVLDTIIRQMALRLEVEACRVFRWNPETEVVTLLAHFGSNGRSGIETQTVDLSLNAYPSWLGKIPGQFPLRIGSGQPDVNPSDGVHVHTSNVKSVLVLPMIFKGRVVGFIELTDHVKRTFCNQDLSLARLLANHAASAIENARLYDEIRRRVEELSTLNEIAQAITSTLDLEKTLTIITGHAIRLLDAEAASVALHDASNGHLRFVAASGEAAEFVLGRQLSMSQGIVGWVLQKGESVLVSDVSRDSRFFGDFDKKSGFATRSILCVPLQSKGRTIGVIEVMNKQNGSFDQDDLRLLSSMAAPAATAIENARLYERAQQEIAERVRAEAALEAERASLATRVAARTAELRKANIELAEANRLKDRFVSNVSHELRTPLSVITLLTGNLDMLYDRWDESKRRKTIHDIRSQARLLNNLIESVLEISRIDDGWIPAERQSVNLTQLVREEADKQRPLAQEKSQKLRLIGVPDLPVRGNAGQLRQVIRNLVNNAIKYTHDGGEITCECRVHAPGLGTETEWPGGSEIPDGNWAALRVVDSGIGISQENLTRLFERFYRVNEQGNVPGVGLGLAIAKELVELHAGHIAVASTLGEGTVFAVYLPLNEE